MSRNMRPTTHQNCAAGPPGKWGSGMFMPHNPEITVSGMKTVVSTVSSFITWFRRLLTLVRWASRMPLMRSWNT